VGGTARGRHEVGLSREASLGGRRGDGRGRTSVSPHGERSHTSALSVTEMPRTPHFRAASVCFRAPDRGPGSRCVYLVPYRGPNTRSASVTVGQHARKRGIPTLFVTRSHPGRTSTILPCGIRGAPVLLRRKSRHPLPAPPAVSATATACPGRGRDGPSLPGRQLEEVSTLPGASLKRSRPFRAPACEASALPGRQLEEGPGLAGRQLAGPRPFPGRQLQEVSSPSGRQLQEVSPSPGGSLARSRPSRPSAPEP
jgi:hypothetical protein